MAFAQMCGTPEQRATFNRLMREDYAPTHEAIRSRLLSLLDRSALFSHVIAGGRSTVDLDRAIQAGKKILVNNSKKTLGSLASDGLGRFLISQALSAVFRRSERNITVPFLHLVVDECSNYANQFGAFETLLTETAKDGASLHLLTQNLSHFSSRLRTIVLSNTSVKYSGFLDATEKSDISKHMNVKRECLDTINRYDFFVKEKFKKG